MSEYYCYDVTPHSLESGTSSPRLIYNCSTLGGLKDKIDELVTLTLDDAHKDEEGHKYDLIRLYQVFFSAACFLRTSSSLP